MNNATRQYKVGRCERVGVVSQRDDNKRFKGAGIEGVKGCPVPASRYVHLPAAGQPGANGVFQA